MSQDDFYQKLARRLSIALAASGMLNIGLLAFGLYEWQEGGFSYLVTCPFKPQKAKLYRQTGKELATLTKSLRELEALDYAQCLLLLEEATPLAEGYKTRDLALSMLVLNHSFDLERALGTPAPARRLFKYMSQENSLAEIILYPDLSNEQFARCIEFATKECWPITPEGMHAKLKGESNDSLKTAFTQTDEYRIVELLLRRASPSTRDEVFSYVMKCDWSHLKTLFDEMRKTQDFSPEVRRSFLVKTLPHSADLLVKCEPRFALHSLQDKETLLILATISPENVKEYATGLLELPRSQAVWQEACVKLSTALGLDPTKETRQSLLQRLGRLQAPKLPQLPKTQIPKVSIPKVTPPKPVVREILYKVQSGDTLWHISKRFGVDIQFLKKHNKLTSDALKPGSTLRIPQQKPPKN